MAEIVDDSVIPGVRGSIGGKIYPWHEWVDGKARKLRRGVDYKTKEASFFQAAYQQARRMGLRVSISSDKDEPGVIYIRFFNKDGSPIERPEKTT